MTEDRKIKGKYAEDRAVQELCNNGYNILERNFRSSFSEIDIIAEKDGCIYFVEVRSKSTDFFGTAFESINAKKKHKIYIAAQAYLHKINKEAECSFMAAAVDLKSGKCEFTEDLF